MPDAARHGAFVEPETGFDRALGNAVLPVSARPPPSRAGLSTRGRTAPLTPGRPEIGNQLVDRGVIVGCRHNAVLFIAFALILMKNRVRLDQPQHGREIPPEANGN